jgi:myo-inositol-1(or 4)-monophosphatase
MNAQPEIIALHQFCRELAHGAGALARERRTHHFTVSTKSTPTDVVTEVDREVETWLVQSIAAHRPDDAVLGEEGGGRPGSSGVRWVLDPIDGTVNFLLGLPAWAVSVAAEVDGVTVAGCVFNPSTEETFDAWLGGGAHLHTAGLHSGDIELGARRVVPLERAVIATGFGYAADRRARQAAVVAHLIARVADIRRIGSASLDLCAVAAGRLDGYFEVGLNPWDWGAGLLIAQESGCASTGLRGRPVGPQMTAIAPATLAPDLFALLEELDADQV